MNLSDFSGLGIPTNVAIFAIAAAFVWGAGYRLARYLDAIADKTSMGEAFVGMLLMGTITSLPEIAAVSTSASVGNAALATNNLLGSVSINVLLIAMADAVLGREAITSAVARPTTLMQGTLVIIALALTAAAILVGDVNLGWFGAWTAALLGFGVFAFWMSSGYSRRAPWQLKEPENRSSPSEKSDDEAQRVQRSYHEKSLANLVLQTVAAAGVILAAGFALAQSGDAIATLTGLGSGIVGLVLVGFATSLPEVSTIVSAVKLGRYEMALGDVFGTNLLTVGLIFLADLAYTGEPILNQAGRFEAAAAVLGIVLTAIFLIGLLERENSTFLRMGYDAVAALLVFIAGIGLLYFMQS